MLSLTRRIGEKIIINDNISVTVMGIKGSQIRLGIDAPSDVSVHREEIFLKVKAERDLLMGMDSSLDINLIDTYRTYSKPKVLTH